MSEFPFLKAPSREEQRIAELEDALKKIRAAHWNAAAFYRRAGRGPEMLELADSEDALADSFTRVIGDAGSDPRLSHVHEQIREAQEKKHGTSKAKD